MSSIGINIPVTQVDLIEPVETNFFHGTTMKAWEIIQETGLQSFSKGVFVLRDKSLQKNCFVTDKSVAAYRYSLMSNEYNKEYSEPVVLRVDISKFLKTGSKFPRGPFSLDKLHTHSRRETLWLINSTA